jgi:hypothetical protein
MVPSEEALRAYLEAVQQVPKVRNVASHMQVLRAGQRWIGGVLI